MTTLKISAAGRLHKLLSRLVAVQYNDPALQVLSREAGTGENDHRAGYRLLATIYDLIDEARDNVRAYPELKQDLYLSALDNLEQLWRTNGPHTGWPSYRTQLPPLLVSLEFCADQLNRLSRETEIPIDELQMLRELAESLTAALLESELPYELRDALVRRVEEIRRALVEYALHGIEDLEAAAHAALGTLVKHLPANPALRDDPLITRYLDLAVKVDGAVSAASKWIALGAPVVHRLFERASQ